MTEATVAQARVRDQPANWGSRISACRGSHSIPALCPRNMRRTAIVYRHMIPAPIRTAGHIDHTIRAAEGVAMGHHRRETILALAIAVATVIGTVPANADQGGVLLSAAKHGDISAARSAIEGGADANCADRRGETALMYAADGWVGDPAKKEGRLAQVSFETQGEDLSMVRVLLDAGADVNARNEGGVTALMRAAGSGSLAVVDALLAAGADVNRRDNDGNTALLHSARYEAANTANTHPTKSKVAALISAGADVNAQNRNGKSALMILAEENGWPKASVLLSHRAVIDAKDAKGNTALMYSALNGHTEMLRLLLAHGATVNVTNGNSSTALMFASMTSDKLVAWYLLAAGADRTLVDDSGFTALAYAQSLECAETAQLLEED